MQPKIHRSSVDKLPKEDVSRQEPRTEIDFDSQVFDDTRDANRREGFDESTIKERHASSLPFSPNDKFVCSAMRKGGDRSSCRGVCPEGRMERGEERGKRQRPVVRHS